MQTEKEKESSSWASPFSLPRGAWPAGKKLAAAGARADTAGVSSSPEEKQQGAYSVVGAWQAWAAIGAASVST